MKFKQRRLTEIIDTHLEQSKLFNESLLGTISTVLVEGTSKKSSDDLVGRNEFNVKVVFPKELHKKGDYVKVKIIDCTSATLIGKAL